MNLPEKFCVRMQKMLGREYEEFISSCEQTPVFTGLRINTMKKNAKESIFAAFGEMPPVPWCSEGFYAEK